MRSKLSILYTLSFFIASLILAITNYIYLKSQVYTESDLYNFYPENEFSQIIESFSIGDNNWIKEELGESIINKGIGIQILDSNLSSIFIYNVNSKVPKRYSPGALIKLYSSKEFTIFAESFFKDSDEFTILLYFDKEEVSRRLYTYDVKRVTNAYNVYWLVGLNTVILLMLSFLFTKTLSNPIYRIVKKISQLREGFYNSEEVPGGPFKEVETNLNLLSKRLENQNRAREEWISNLTHDIKTPLTSIIGHAELLADREYSVPRNELIKRSDSIVHKGKYIDELVNDLNLITRLGAGGIKLKRESIELNNYIKNIIGSIFPENSIRLQSREELINLKVDKKLFMRALINIVNNSFIHNNKNIEVSIELIRRSKNDIIITIKDNGRGVSPEDLKKIFSRYYRGTNTQIEPYGTGLGMAIAREVILAHEGEIYANNQKRGGLEITICLKTE